MERSWWYRGRALAVSTLLRKARVQHVGTILDYGAGYGGMSGTLRKFGIDVVAYEPDQEANAEARKRGYSRLFSSDDEALTSRTYDLIGAFDVVEHIEHDDVFLRRAYEALKAGGHIAITVPAFPFLWSSHDVSHHHYRRYTKRSMRAALNAVGFSVTHMSYWNACLFVPAASMRLLGKTGEGALALPRWLDAIFYRILWIESFFMRFVSLPFGTGLVVVAQKNR